MFACVDPDPYSENGSGSRKLLNTHPIRIRVHNTGLLRFSEQIARFFAKKGPERINCSWLLIFGEQLERFAHITHFW